MPHTGNRLFGSCGEMVKMCCTGCTSWINEPRPCPEVCALGCAGTHAGGWANQVPEAHSGMANSYLHLQLSLNSGDSGPLYSQLLHILCLQPKTESPRPMWTFRTSFEERPLRAHVAWYWLWAFLCWKQQHLRL